MNFSKAFFLSLLFLVAFAPAVAQEQPPTIDPGRRGSRVVDDTTRQIYGPNTSKYFYEADIFFNRSKIQPIDTAIRNFHRWNYVQRNNNLYQDLGNIGSAIQPIFYRQPESIGVHTGMHVYDLYWDTEQMRYFDTRSPYTNMYVMLGGDGRSITRATYSRNINPRWNIGATYRGLFIDRQIARTGKADRFVRSNYYDLFTTFQSKDSTYRLFANIRRVFHRAEEFGGAKTESDTVDAEYFEENVIPWLSAVSEVESNDLRINAHVFQQYQIGRALQLYHVFDRYRQKNNFLDVRGDDDDDFFDFVAYETDSVRDVVKTVNVRNELGIKGNISKVFYNGYYAIRNYYMTNNRFRPDTLEHIVYDSLGFPTGGNEHYLGGRIEVNLDSIGLLNGGIEVMREGNYKVYGEIKSKWFEARIKQMRYKPGFVQNAYRGGYDTWNYNFGNTESTQLNGYLHYRSSVLRVSPGLTFSRLNNYIFFKKVTDNDTLQQVLPVQSNGNQIIASPELRLGLTFFRHIHLNAQVIYTRLLENAGDAISVPEIFANGQLSWSNIFFNDNLDLHVGVDVHWKSDYYADGYDPAIRQFYRQDEFISPAFPLVDIFLNVKVKRGRVFFKYHNLLASEERGYFPTPRYPGQRNIFDFGFDWSFYD